MAINSIKILNRINSFEEYNKKIEDYKEHISKLMIGKKDQPIPLHVMVVSGDKGVGKTYTAEQLLSAQDIRNYEIVTGSLSPVQFYKFMWEHNDAIIVLDDVNSIIQDSKDGASLLKACTESRVVRQLHWQKQNHKCVNVHKLGLKNNDAIEEKMREICSMDPKMEKAYNAGQVFPDTFFFTGAIIILTNKPLSVIDKATEGALSNRGWHQEMLFSVDGAVDLIRHMAQHMHDFNGQNISEENMKKAVDFVTSDAAISYYKNNGKLPTIRTLGRIAVECEQGCSLDTDTLVNNTECPAY